MILVLCVFLFLTGTKKCQSLEVGILHRIDLELVQRTDAVLQPAYVFGYRFDFSGGDFFLGYARLQVVYNRRQNTGQGQSVGALS